MNLRLFTPVCAVLALAACNNSDDELSGEALEMDEVAAAAADMDMRLNAGQYQSTSQLVEFTLEGLSPEMQRMAEQGFAQGASSGHTYCVGEDMTSEQWVSQMNESDCTVTRFDDDGGTMNATLQCNDPEGMNGNVEMTGIAEGDSAEMDVRFTVQIPGMGEGQVHMKTKSERIGDCA